MHMAFLYTTRILEVDYMDLLEPFQINVKIERESNFDLDNESHFFYDTQEVS